ncbi:MAG: hypothetical protein EAZ76_03265 [Nostocales cyanobacterium]|nr:MAG: hypothetical protein EAZ87_20865 [Nostocales cyanobacterium]TAF19485.1 MAG: hypothetical protein EAZ76_03265 [Nostocales cyanobacterium]
MNLIKLAKQGDITAISELINRALNPQNIKATVNVDHDKLIVILESERKLNQAEISQFIYKGLSKLNLSLYSTLVICGKRTNPNIIEWQKEVKFPSQVPAEIITLNTTNTNNIKPPKPPKGQQIVPANPNTTGTIVHVNKKIIDEVETIKKSANYLQKVSYLIIILSWLLITIQGLFTLTIIYDTFISRSQLFYTIINITDTTGIVSSWLEQLLYIFYKYWDILKIIQSSLERVIYLILIIWVYRLHITIIKINNNYPITPGKAVISFSIPLYNLWGVWNVLSNLSSYLDRQHREIASTGRKIKKYLPWLYLSIFFYILIYVIYIIYNNQALEKNTWINSILYLAVDILFICRSFLYLQIIKISYQAVYLQAELFRKKFIRM